MAGRTCPTSCARLRRTFRRDLLQYGPRSVHIISYLTVFYVHALSRTDCDATFACQMLVLRDRGISYDVFVHVGLHRHRPVPGVGFGAARSRARREAMDRRESAPRLVASGSAPRRAAWQPGRGRGEVLDDGAHPPPSGTGVIDQRRAPTTTTTHQRRRHARLGAFRTSSWSRRAMHFSKRPAADAACISACRDRCDAQ